MKLNSSSKSGRGRSRQIGYYGSRIEWHLFFFFSMGAHTKKEKKMPFYSATVMILISMGSEQ